MGSEQIPMKELGFRPCQLPFRTSSQLFLRNLRHDCCFSRCPNPTMRLWQNLGDMISQLSQPDPPRFVALVLLNLALVALFLVALGGAPDWPYLILSLSYAFGAAATYLVKEAVIPSPQTKLTQGLKGVLLVLLVGSVWGLTAVLQALI